MKLRSRTPARSRPDAASRPTLDPEVERARVLAIVSLLLGYPDPELIGQLPAIEAATDGLADPARSALRRFAAHLRTVPLPQLAADYVETFDLRRRCCLYLTYYAHGDTRKRGAALVRFTHAYRSAGLPPPEGELADHLGVVCHFAAVAPEAGLELLAGHRAGVELLRMALVECRSPYADVLEALGAVLPEAGEADLARAMDLARSGPPAEEVGLEPFGPPEYMGGRR